MKTGGRTNRKEPQSFIQGPVDDVEIRPASHGRPSRGVVHPWTTLWGTRGRTGEFRRRPDRHLRTSIARAHRLHASSTGRPQGFPQAGVWTSPEGPSPRERSRLHNRMKQRAIHVITARLFRWISTPPARLFPRFSTGRSAIHSPAPNTGNDHNPRGWMSVNGGGAVGKTPGRPSAACAAPDPVVTLKSTAGPTLQHRNTRPHSIRAGSVRLAQHQVPPANIIAAATVGSCASTQDTPPLAPSGARVPFRRGPAPSARRVGLSTAPHVLIQESS